MVESLHRGLTKAMKQFIIMDDGTDVGSGEVKDCGGGFDTMGGVKEE